jgi:hypothetical protein
MAAAHPLTDHEEIRKWAEARGAKPTCVRGTGGKGDTGMIRLDFPGYSGAGKLQPISWDDWFASFDENNLALLVQDTLARGGKSNFNKLVARRTAQGRQKSRRTGTSRSSSRTSGRKTSSAAKGGARKTSSRATSKSKSAGSSAGRKSSSSRSTGSRAASARSASTRSASGRSAARSSGRSSTRSTARSSSRKRSTRK